MEGIAPGILLWFPRGRHGYSYLFPRRACLRFVESSSGTRDEWMEWHENLSDACVGTRRTWKARRRWGYGWNWRMSCGLFLPFGPRPRADVVFNFFQNLYSQPEIASKCVDEENVYMLLPALKKKRLRI